MHTDLNLLTEMKRISVQKQNKITKATMPGSPKRFNPPLTEDLNFQSITDSETVKRRTRTKSWNTKNIKKKNSWRSNCNGVSNYWRERNRNQRMYNGFRCSEVRRRKKSKQVKDKTKREIEGGLGRTHKERKN